MATDGKRMRIGDAELEYSESVGWICVTCHSDDCAHVETAYEAAEETD